MEDVVKLYLYYQLKKNMGEKWKDYFSDKEWIANFFEQFEGRFLEEFHFHQRKG
jgi:hypothetical protein